MSFIIVSFGVCPKYTNNKKTEQKILRFFQHRHPDSFSPSFLFMPLPYHDFLRHQVAPVGRQHLDDIETGRQGGLYRRHPTREVRHADTGERSDAHLCRHGRRLHAQRASRYRHDRYGHVHLHFAYPRLVRKVSRPVTVRIAELYLIVSLQLRS